MCAQAGRWPSQLKVDRRRCPPPSLSLSLSLSPRARAGAARPRRREHRDHARGQQERPCHLRAVSTEEAMAFGETQLRLLRPRHSTRRAWRRHSHVPTAAAALCRPRTPIVTPRSAPRAAPHSDRDLPPDEPQEHRRRGEQRRTPAGERLTLTDDSAVGKQPGHGQRPRSCYCSQPGKKPGGLRELASQLLASQEPGPSQSQA